MQREVMNIETPFRILFLTVLLAINPQTFGQDKPDRPLQEINSPVPANSAEPNLFATPDGRIFLSWIEKLASGHHALRFAVRHQGKWAAAQTIAEGTNWFVNWADFPSLVALDDGSLLAHWLVKSGADTYAYDVNISRSTDKGKTWSKPFVPHTDKTHTEHGFVSLLPLSKGRVGAIWLDGRKFKGDGKGHDAHELSANEMTLRYATIDGQGRRFDEAEIDGRTCECCQTSAAVTSQGLIVAYRDRSEEEVRDISVARLVKGKWTTPKRVNADDWKINGCPVNGPSIAALGNRVAVAWFTGANDVAKVRLAFSDDGGATFKSPIQVDDGKPAGRVEVTMLADGSAFVVWLEHTEKRTEIRARHIQANGTTGSSIIVTESSSARASGFPQIVRAGGELVFAWTDPTVPSRVRVAVMKLNGGKNQ